MNLPEETLELAEKKASDLGESPAEELYELTEEIDYGFREALKEGKYFRYPHELEDKATCHEKAVFTYAVAKKAGLNPRFLKREHSGGDIHPFVDVETEEGRKIIDSHYNMYGAIKHYSDHKIEVKDNETTFHTSKTYNRIEQLKEDSFIGELKNLRRNPAAMIARTQSLKESGYDGDFKDKIKFDKKERALIRNLNSTDNTGFLNDNVKIKWFFNTEGEVKDRKILFNAINGSGWNDLQGEQLIAEKKEDGNYRTPEEMSKRVKEDIKTLGTYKQKKTGERLYTEEELENVLDQIKESAEHVITDNTGFRGRTVKNWIESMEKVRENDSKYFLDYSDWLNFLKENETKAVDTEDVIPERLERHEELLDKALKGEAQESLEAAKKEIKCVLEGDNVSPEKQVEQIEKKGLSSAYSALAEELQDMLEDGFKQESLRSLQELGPLAVVEPEIRQRLGLVLEKVAERSGEEEQKLLENYIEETDKTFKDTGNPDRPWKAEIQWGYDPEEHRIKQVVTAKEGFSDYNTRMEVGYSIDEDEENKLKIEETVEGTDETFTFTDRNFEELEDLEADSLSAEAWKKAPEIISRNNLNAPEPSLDEDFFTKNIGAVLFYASNDWRGKTRFFDREKLEEFAEKAKQEDEWFVESPFYLKERREKVRKEIETAWGREEDRGNVLEQNKIIGLMNKGDREKLLQIADQHYDSKREMAADYSQKHANMVDEHIGREEIQQKKEVLKESVRKGLQMSRPSDEDVIEFAKEAGFENLRKAARNLDEEEPVNLDSLEEDVEEISDREEKRNLIESIGHLERRTDSEKAKEKLQKLHRKAEKTTPEQNLREALKQKEIELES